MRIKYFYQQLTSHIGVIVIAFLILSLLFSHYIEKFVYDEKTEELANYGQQILHDLASGEQYTQSVLQQYERVLHARDIQYNLFNEQSEITFSTGLGTPPIELKDEEWRYIQNGNIVAVKRSYDRFDEDVTFVLLPHFQHDQFVGGILLASSIKGTRAVITQLNHYLMITMGIALLIALIVSWIVATFHGKRIKKLQNATSLVASGHYDIRLPTAHFDELSELSMDFNQMIEKLQQSMDEIETLENRRRQFMADVSHELRTPLTTIRGMIEGLQNDMISEHEKAKALTLASNETKRLIRLVNENLDYEKIRSNQIELYIQPIQLKALFEIIQEQLQDVAAERNNTIKVHCDDQAIVYADDDRLTQVLINIIKNSIQFTENGTITLKGFEQNGQTFIEVIDTGIGMDPDEIEKIWDRFYKAIVSRTTNPYGEFGLGLSIVKQLVQLQNGSISVTSEKNKGTAFHLAFPKR